VLMIPCILAEPVAPGANGQQKLRKAVFDADTGIVYVEIAPDCVSVVGPGGVQLMFKSSLDDWCTKLLEAAAAPDAGDEPEEIRQ